ncbi:unnamed protein product, partial [Staurois parvus]
VSCDWSQLVTWYKAVVNSLVPCDLCDHSQISHVVSNDVTSDILLTTLHVITDSPISDHMIGTSYRGPPGARTEDAGDGEEQVRLAIHYTIFCPIFAQFHLDLPSTM